MFNIHNHFMEKKGKEIKESHMYRTVKRKQYMYLLQEDKTLNMIGIGRM